MDQQNENETKPTPATQQPNPPMEVYPPDTLIGLSCEPYDADVARMMDEGNPNHGEDC